jgi:hypothetical protein
VVVVVVVVVVVEEEEEEEEDDIHYTLRTILSTTLQSMHYTKHYTAVSALY